jgi:hypothetical protein
MLLLVHHLADCVKAGLCHYLSPAAAPNAPEVRMQLAGDASCVHQDRIQPLWDLQHAYLVNQAHFQVNINIKLK